jgi:hypothetical protein
VREVLEELIGKQELRELLESPAMARLLVASEVVYAWLRRRLGRLMPDLSTAAGRTAAVRIVSLAWAGTVAIITLCLIANKAQAAPQSPAAAAVEEVRADVESLDAEIQEGLAQMAIQLKEFEAERRTWTSLDMTVEAARKVNRALLKRNRAVVRLYERSLSGPIERFRERLAAAPAAYRLLARERLQNAREATLESERQSYRLMAYLCESAARLCERRYGEVFGGDPGRPNAVTLAETIGNMRRYQAVHSRWEDTLARFPSSLEDRRMTALFAHLSVYAEDLHSFSEGVEALNEAMRRKAADQGGPSPSPRASQPDRIAART